jgi:hypothetical protein
MGFSPITVGDVLLDASLSPLAFETVANVATSATYSSGILDARGYLQVQAEILSDKDGTIAITFYEDAGGSNIVRATSIPYLALGGYQFFATPIFANYVKYEFTNTEGTNTTSFYFASKLQKTAISPQLIRADAIVSPPMISSLTRTANHFDLDTARQHITGQRSFFFFGFNDDVDQVWEDIHATGGDINWLTTATKVEVLSSHVSDNVTGSGLRSVEIHGLSDSGVDQEEVINLSGSTPVSSDLSYIRVNKMHSEEVGTYGGSHQGDVTCRITGSGAVLTTMKGSEGTAGTSVQYGRGEAGNGYWSVPFGKVMYITRLSVSPSTGNNQTINIALYERDSLLTISAPFQPRRVLWEVAKLNEPIIKDFKSHIKIKALTDIWFRGIGSGDNNTIEVSCDFYLVDADSVGA